VKGILSDTDEETSKRPIAVRSGRRSGLASATILRKDAEVEAVPSALDEMEAGRMRESMERRMGTWEDVGDKGEVGGGWCGGEAWGVKLAAKKRFWSEVNVGHGGCPRADEGWTKVRWMDSARRPRAQEE
jgi:hypothetical protein